MITYQLQCGHTGAMRQWPNEWVYCPTDDAKVKLFAIETREYKIKCNKCRFARWCGQSRTMAELGRDAHMRKNPGHTLVVDYLQYPETATTVAKVYGSRMHRNIIASRELPARVIKIRDVSLPDDEPPF